MGIYAIQLAEVRAAITQVLSNGQSTGFNGQNLAKANLDTLYKEQARLEPLAASELAAESNAGRGRNRIVRVSI